MSGKKYFVFSKVFMEQVVNIFNFQKKTYCSNNSSHTLSSESVKNREGIDRLKGLDGPTYNVI